MPIRIKTNQTFKKLAKMLPDARSEYAKEMKREMEGIITDQMAKGLSPVKGFGRYKKKANGEQSYLRDTGKLYDSVSVKQKGFVSKTITVSVGSNEVPYAQYHQFGTPNLDARPILPTRGLEFKQNIIKRLFRSALNAVKKAAKKVR